MEKTLLLKILWRALSRLRCWLTRLSPFVPPLHRLGSRGVDIAAATTGTASWVWELIPAKSTSAKEKVTTASTFLL